MKQRCEVSIPVVIADSGIPSTTKLRANLDVAEKTALLLLALGSRSLPQACPQRERGHRELGQVRLGLGGANSLPALLLLLRVL